MPINRNPESCFPPNWWGKSTESFYIINEIAFAKATVESSDKEMSESKAEISAHSILYNHINPIHNSIENIIQNECQFQKEEEYPNKIIDLHRPKSKIVIGADVINIETCSSLVYTNKYKVYRTYVEIQYNIQNYIDYSCSQCYSYKPCENTQACDQICNFTFKGKVF